MSIRRVAVTVLSLAALLTPALAITGGSVDPGTEHPNVGIVVMRANLLGDGTRAAICSGTLIHERVVLTAGHCVDAFQSFIDGGLSSGINQLSVNFVTPHTPAPVGGDNRAVVSMALFPGWKPNVANANVSDVGLLILAQPVAGIEPATLPTAGYLDGLKKAGALRGGVQLRLAGFGTYLDPLTPPTPTLGDPPFPRRYVDSDYRQILKRQLQASNNQRSGDGGTCYGDSGGPAFLTDPDSGERILVGVTSWGDVNCVGTGLCARTDLEDVLDWIEDNLP